MYLWNQSNLCAWSLRSCHPTHTHGGGRLCVVSFDPSWSRRQSTGEFSIETLFSESPKERSISLERFRLKSTRIPDEAPCEVREGEFGSQTRFLCAVGKIFLNPDGQFVLLI